MSRRPLTFPKKRLIVHRRIGPNVSLILDGILIIAMLCTLSACAAPAEPGRMVPEPAVVRADGFAPALHNAIALAKVGGGEKTHPLGVSKVGDEEMTEALRLSLQRYGVYASSGIRAPFRLEVFLIELRQPVNGLTMIVTSVVRYRLVRNSDGRSIYDDVITASYRAATDEAFTGVQRLKLANEGSIRANIASFLASLHSLDVAKVPLE